MIDLTKTPEDWVIKRIGNITKTVAGGTPSTSQKQFWGGDIKWMSSGELNLKRVLDVEGRITELGLKSSSTRLLPPRCVLIGLAGQGKTRGTVAMNMVELCTNQSVAAILPSSVFFEDYLFHNLDFRYDELRQLSTGEGGRGGLNLNIINSVKIPIPPLPEQHAIAKVLGKMDEAINANNQLIAQKALRKKWLMQNLLTGKKRLKGFSGEWKEIKLGKLFNEIKSVNDGATTHSIMTISSKRGLISQEDKFARVIAGDSLKKYTQLTKNDFAYNKGNSKTYPMGCIYQLEVNESALVPFVYICFSPTELVDSKFYKQWFLAYGLDRQLKKIITSGARGDGLLNVNKHNFFNLKTIYPPKEEQTAIAQILQAADKELSLLKAKTDKLKEQKKGMMQVLLTGKKRLNQDLQDLNIYRINALEHNLESPANSESPNPNNNLENPKNL
jgi:type I restriction enzyme S subunit